jgi:hypothetical protein
MAFDAHQFARGVVLVDHRLKPRDVAALAIRLRTARARVGRNEQGQHENHILHQTLPRSKARIGFACGAIMAGFAQQYSVWATIVTMDVRSPRERA